MISQLSSEPLKLARQLRSSRLQREEKNRQAGASAEGKCKQAVWKRGQMAVDRRVQVNGGGRQMTKGEKRKPKRAHAGSASFGGDWDYGVWQ